MVDSGIRGNSAWNLAGDATTPGHYTVWVTLDLGLVCSNVEDMPIHIGEINLWIEEMKPISYDIDLKRDAFVSEYEAIRDSVLSSISREMARSNLDRMENLAYRGSLLATLFVADHMRWGIFDSADLTSALSWYGAAVEAKSARGVSGQGLTLAAMGKRCEAGQKLREAIDLGYVPAVNALASILYNPTLGGAGNTESIKLWKQGIKNDHVLSKVNYFQRASRFKFGIKEFLESMPVFASIFSDYMFRRHREVDTDRWR